jgi:hypothetical protein
MALNGTTASLAPAPPQFHPQTLFGVRRNAWLDAAVDRLVCQHFRSMCKIYSGAKYPADSPNARARQIAEDGLFAAVSDQLCTQVLALATTYCVLEREDAATALRPLSTLITDAFWERLHALKPGA